MSTININGKLIPENEAKISVKDRGFRFGDGIFDTIKVVAGKLYRFDMHMQRIKGGLAALKIDFDTSSLQEEILNTIHYNNIDEGIARISITRGEGSRGYMPTRDMDPNYVIETMSAREMDLFNIRLCVSSYTKPSASSMPVNFKLMQGLNSTLAKMEARETGFFDAVLLNDKGQICECSSSNIFWVKGNRIFTPSLDCGILDGVTRKIVLELYGNNISEGIFTLDDISDADEIFITNSVIGILPVKEVEGIFYNEDEIYGITERVSDLYHDDISNFRQEGK